MVKIVEEEEEAAAGDELVASPYSITPSSFQTTPSSSNNHHHPSPPPSHPASPSSSDQTFHGFSPKPSPPPSPPASLTRLIRDDPPPNLIVTEPGPVSGFAYEGGGGADQSSPPKPKGKEKGIAKGKASYSAASRKGATARGAAVALRVFEFVVCLISFSVMAADNNRGWALDSFHRYKEFRYCITVNVIGFAYSAIQGFTLAYHLTTGNQHFKPGQMRCFFDFFMDQILAYLLVSASSSAATRVEDWISNWGQDKFPAMAGASVAMSFLAFVAFAFSSLISGYILST